MLRAIPVLLASALCAQAPAPQTAPQAAPAQTQPAPVSANIALVQRQTDAYNAQDAQVYAACFSADAQLIRHPGITQLQGHDEIYRNFAKFFREHKQARMRILYRADLGPATVIEHQEVDGLGKTPVQSMVIYNIQNGAIRAAWFVAAE